ncbi:MAG: hypothetical protein ACT4P6_12250 [Gemmatimonadaceae bacterium]
MPRALSLVALAYAFADSAVMPRVLPNERARRFCRSFSAALFLVIAGCRGPTDAPTQPTAVGTGLVASGPAVVIEFEFRNPTSALKQPELQRRVESSGAVDTPEVLFGAATDRYRSRKG